MKEYDKIAAWFAANRSRHIGVPEVRAVTRGLPKGAKVLDLGCGTGIPLSEALCRSGFAVFGIDSSQEMVKRFRSNCPQADVACETIQNSDFFNLSFAAVVAWGVLFHLPAAAQKRAIAKISQHLNPGGFFLFTAGKEKGTVKETMNGVLFRYTSLGSDSYRKLLKKNGFEVLDEYDDDWENHVFVAKKTG